MAISVVASPSALDNNKNKNNKNNKNNNKKIIILNNINKNKINKNSTKKKYKICYFYMLLKPGSLPLASYTH